MNEEIKTAEELHNKYKYPINGQILTDDDKNLFKKEIRNVKIKKLLK